MFFIPKTNKKNILEVILHKDKLFQQCLQNCYNDFFGRKMNKDKIKILVCCHKKQIYPKMKEEYYFQFMLVRRCLTLI